MRTLNAAEPQFPGDDGAVDPAVAAALAAYAAGQGSEHAALTALATSRLLVPVVAVLTEEEGGATASGGRALRPRARAAATLPRPAAGSASCAGRSPRRWRCPP